MSIKQNSRALIIHAVLLFGCDANEQPHAAEQPPAANMRRAQAGKASPVAGKALERLLGA